MGCCQASWDAGGSSLRAGAKHPWARGGMQGGCFKLGATCQQAEEGTLIDSVSLLLAQLNEKGRMSHKAFSTSSLSLVLLGFSPTDAFPQQHSSRGDSHIWYRSPASPGSWIYKAGIAELRVLHSRGLFYLQLQKVGGFSPSMVC